MWRRLLRWIGWDSVILAVAVLVAAAVVKRVDLPIGLSELLIILLIVAVVFAASVLPRLGGDE